MNIILFPVGVDQNPLYGERQDSVYMEDYKEETYAKDGNEDYGYEN